VIVPATWPGRAYELKAVAILAFGFGLVGIDRFMISAMFPAIAADLKLGYEDIGTITGALAIAWGIAAFFMGNLSDRLGRRKILVGSMVVFSLLIGASGLAGGLMTLVLVRVIMGLADGAYTPPSITATLEASPPQRHGLNLGIQQMMLPLFGLGIAPILVTQLLEFIDWRWVFPIFAVPGLLAAWLMHRWIRDNGSARPASDEAMVAAHASAGSFDDYKRVLKVYNIRLLSIGMLCWLTCLVTTSAFLPSYLIEHAALSGVEMGFVMSAIGWGATAGTVLLPWLSDRLGRKPVMMLCTLGALASLMLLSMASTATGLFASLFATHFFNFALITLTVGPVSSESAPPTLMATASGTIIAIGELFGGGVAPIVVGFTVGHFGIDHMLWLPMLAMAAGFVIAVLIEETAPIHRSRQEVIS